MTKLKTAYCTVGYPTLHKLASWPSCLKKLIVQLMLL